MSSFIHNKLLGLFVKTNGVLSKPLFGGIGHVFMLHRVNLKQERERYPINKNLIITPDYLENRIVYLKQNNYDFISLDQLYEILIEAKKPKKKFVCITLDDGYRDNMTHGLPVFEKYNIPITIYVTNSFPNQTASFWWYWLEEYILNNNSLIYKDDNLTFSNLTEKKTIYNILRNKIKNLSKHERDEFILNNLSKDSKEIQNEREYLALSWNDLKELQKHTLVNIGAHTINHLSLANISIDEMKKEILNSKTELEDKLNIKINHFSYPYGSADDINREVVEFVKECGFITSTINHPGNIFLKSKNKSLLLPRYPLGDNVTDEQFSHYLNGIKHFAVNKTNKTCKFN